MKNQTMMIIGGAVVVLIVLLIYFRKGLYTTTPAKENPWQKSTDMLNRAGNSFVKLAPDADKALATKMSASLKTFNTQALAGNVVDAMGSFNDALRSLNAMNPTTLAVSVMHSHPQACYQPHIKTEVIATLEQLKTTAALLTGTVAWTEAVAAAIPDCPAVQAPPIAVVPMHASPLAPASPPPIARAQLVQMGVPVPMLAPPAPVPTAPAHAAGTPVHAMGGPDPEWS
jgi:hypothetical protein